MTVSMEAPSAILFGVARNRSRQHVVIMQGGLPPRASQKTCMNFFTLPMSLGVTRHRHTEVRPTTICTVVPRGARCA